MQRTAEDFADTMRPAINNVVDIVMGGKNRLKEIFKQMAKDYIAEFIGEILIATALAVLKLLAQLAIFDKRENDMMAMRVGRDYARFFTQGVFEELSTGELARAMASQTTGGALQIGTAVPANQLSGGGVTIVIQGNLIGTEQFVKESLIPQIEQAVLNKESDLVLYTQLESF